MSKRNKFTIAITILFVAVVLLNWKQSQRESKSSEAITPSPSEPEAESLGVEETPAVREGLSIVAAQDHPTTIAIEEKAGTPIPSSESESSNFTQATVTLRDIPNRKVCLLNLRAIYDAGARIAAKTKPHRLPLNLMLLRTELPDASVLICPNDPNVANTPIEWDKFDPALITYRVHFALLKGFQVSEPGIDRRYLFCPFHRILLSGNRNAMTLPLNLSF